MIRSEINIDHMQFCFLLVLGTTGAIFVLHQLQEKHVVKHKQLYFVWINLKKAFYHVPRKVLWLTMRKVGVEEWVICVVLAMYENLKSKGNFSYLMTSSVSGLGFIKEQYSALYYIL